MKKLLLTTILAIATFYPITNNAATSKAISMRSLGEAHFEIDKDTNTLIVVTDDKTNQIIKKVITELDKPVPQALIKVLFLEVTHNDDLDLGTDIKYDKTNKNGTQSIINSLFGVTTTGTGGSMAILDKDLQVTLKALAQVTKMEVLSRPSIMTRNNEEATITIGDEVPFVTNSRVTDDGQTINTIEYEDIGIILTVTPHINKNGLVELDVTPEISTLTGETVTISKNVNAEVFAKRSAETKVIVPDGKTVVIGGLMDTQETVSVKKVPILGDLWLIGSLFRRKITKKNKTELLIFLTPNVVTVEEQLKNLTDFEHKKTQLIRKSFTPEILKDFLNDSPNKKSKKNLKTNN